MRTSLCLLTALAATLPAQNSVWSPAGSAIHEGNNNNTIPIWSTSSTYQQLHDFENMNPVLNGTPTLLLGLMLRKEGNGASFAGRTFDLQMTVGATSVSATAPSTTFATNLGASPTVVLPYTPINLPTLTNISVPNPPGLVVPWSTPFVYAPAPGSNFCWEWRHMNNTNTTFGAMDAEDVNAYTGGLEGTGCLTFGQTRTATVEARSLNLNALTYQTRLRYAAPNAPGVFVLGGQRVNISLPGQCAPLLLNPLIFVSGGTDATGIWDMTLPTPNLRGGPQIELLGQYAWIDGLQPLGLGFSDMSWVKTAMNGTPYMCRLYAGPYQGGAGYELATTALGQSLGYGLITGFVVP